MDRREFLIAGGTAMAAGWLHPAFNAGRPRPSRAQLAWQSDELAMFVHFGVNTFTDREWGDGREDPAIFNPTSLDARQWAHAARVAGFRAMILTAKHHDGFCLWPTATTAHSVAHSPFRNGSGDVVREFVDACRAEDLRPGLYLSPWDRNNPAYGDSPRYNNLYCDQLTELLTRYGPIAEMWFDGANGEGPNGRRQVYDWPRTWALVRKLQPDAVMFSDAGPDVRWCGNERGTAGDPNWSTVDPSVVSVPGESGPGVTDMLQHGTPLGMVWRPAEVDVSIRPGWFHHAAEDAKVRDVDNLLELYHTSVGRNAKLLLNVPPTRDGLLHSTDVERLRAFGQRRTARFAEDVARDAAMRWHSGKGSAAAQLELRRVRTISSIRLEEAITRGQKVARYAVYGSTRGAGDWKLLSRGTTIGYARIDRFEPASVKSLRVEFDVAGESAEPIIVRAFA
ncbi:MAG TPA: alpha-L-fucosidase [Gemmatimonadaceae bacterium]